MSAEVSYPDRKQEVAYLIDLIEKRAELLIAEKKDELRELLFRKDMTFGEVGREMLASEFESNKIPLHIVRCAALQLLSKTEYEAVVRKNISLGISRGTGGETWHETEIAFVKNLIADPNYLHPKGSVNVGHPDFKKIVAALNAKFYAGAPTRSHSALCRMVANRSDLFERRNRGKPWLEQELKRLEE